MAANDPEIGKRIVAAGIETNCLEAGEGKPLRGIFRRCEQLMTRFAPSKIRALDAGLLIEESFTR